MLGLLVGSKTFCLHFFYKLLEIHCIFGILITILHIFKHPEHLKHLLLSMGRTCCSKNAALASTEADAWGKGALSCA